MMYKKRSKGNIVRIFLLWLAVLVIAIVPRIVQEPAERIECRFLHVIDGDTIAVQYKQEVVNVRLIGVDAPESVHPEESNNTKFGEMASWYTEDLLAHMDYVYLEFDEDMYDSYDRLLAYVYRDAEVAFEESLNYRLVEDGYAVNKEYQPNVKYASKLDIACQKAKEQQRGLWKSGGLSN